MQFISDQGFILKRRNFGEADRIVTIFSKDSGKITVIAKGVRKITSRRGGLLEPLNHIKFHTVQSYSRKVLTEVELISSFERDQYSLENYKNMFIACELLDALCGEDLPLRGFYDKVVDFAYSQNESTSLEDFKSELLVNLGYWERSKKFLSEDDSYRYIESIIEKKLKSRTISF